MIGDGWQMWAKWWHKDWDGNRIQGKNVNGIQIWKFLLKFYVYKIYFWKHENLKNQFEQYYLWFQVKMNVV